MHINSWTTAYPETTFQILVWATTSRWPTTHPLTNGSLGLSDWGKRCSAKFSCVSRFAIVYRFAFGLTQHQTRHLAVCVQEEFRGGACRLERRLRLRSQRKRVQVEPAIDQCYVLLHTYEARDNPRPFAKLIPSNVLCENGRAHSHTLVCSGHHVNLIPVRFVAHILEHVRI